MGKSKLHLGLLLIAISSAITVQAVVPVLEWDPNPEPAIGGYHVYIGNSSRNYALVLDVGGNTRFPLTNLNQGATYFLAVTAYDASNLESPFSEEVSYTPPLDGVTTAALPCAVTVSNNVKTLRFSGRIGQLCRIMASADLRQWEQVYSVTLLNSNSVQFVDGANRPSRFYRVIATPP